jgi:hypothetical protein
MELRYGGKLKVGDPIAVSYQSNIIFGLFAGYGRGTIQFYVPNTVIYQYDWAMENNRGPKFHKDYIHGTNVENRVMKVNPEVLHEQKDIIEYEKAIDILKQYNFIQ